MSLYQKDCFYYTEVLGYSYCNLAENSIEETGCIGCKNYEYENLTEDLDYPIDDWED